MDKSRLLTEVERALSRELEGSAVIHDASRYAVFPAGKRIRPIMALLLTADLRADPLAYITPACALELVHSSSLVHDDLPCMDNDDLRRGRPTVHRAFSESTALLAGDFLISKSFEILLSDESISAGQRVLLGRSLAAAYRSLCEGQALDLNTDKDSGMIRTIHRLKTGALFRATFEFGGIFAAVDDLLRITLGNLGEQFGVLFQILDDYLDIHGDPAARGRPAGSDAKKQKGNFFHDRCGRRGEANFSGATRSAPTDDY